MNSNPPKSVPSFCITVRLLPGCFPQKGGRFFTLKIQLRRQVAVGVEADGLLQEGLVYAEVVGQVPGLGVALGHGGVQVLLGDQGVDGVFIRPVFVEPPDVPGAVAVVEAAGGAVAQLVGQPDPELVPAAPVGEIQADGAVSRPVHAAHRARQRQGKMQDGNIQFLRAAVQGGKLGHSFTSLR